MPLNVVLVEPEIPQNAGNIVRTCAVTGSVVHMVKPLGFEVSDKYLKIAVFITSFRMGLFRLR